MEKVFILAIFTTFLIGCGSKVGEADELKKSESKEPAGAPDNVWTLKGLGAEGPDPALTEKLKLFGQFIGDWEIRSEWFRPDGTTVKGKGEVHYKWILKGTAIQDVWMGDIETPPPGVPRTAFGTTIRIYDPKLDAWQVVWVEPSASVIQTFTARQAGDEIVLEGKNQEGAPERWIYSEITPRSFQWRAEMFRDDQKTWELLQKISARRVV